MRVPVRNMQGETVREIDLRPDIFEAPVNVPLMHQALVRQLANGRQGTHSTKTRSENNRSKSKWYRQKGTGRARHGSRNAPIFVGGGIAHGPSPRSYEKRMPRKMHRAAVRSALSAKAAAGDILWLEEVALSKPRTREMVELFKNLAVEDHKILLVLAERDENIGRAVRNLPKVQILHAGYLNVRDLLSAETIVASVAALETIEAILGKSGVAVEMAQEEEAQS